MQSGKKNNENRSGWERRSKLFGISLKSVLFKGMPDVVNEHLHNWHSRIILESIEHKVRLRILDVGCGYGRLSLPIIENFPDVEIIGMDVSENYVKLYRDHTRQSAFVGSIEEIPKDLGKFDYIICVTVLMYLDDEKLEKAVTNLMLHLKHDGKIIIIENDSSGLIFQTGFGIVTFLRKCARRDNVNTGGRTFKKNEIKKLVKSKGGRILSERRMPFTTFKILPLCIVGKVFPAKFTKCIYRIVQFFDILLEKFKLPSIYAAYIISSK